MDSTLIRITHRIWYWNKRQQLLNFIREQVPTTDETLPLHPDLPKENADFQTRKYVLEIDTVSSDHMDELDA